MWSLLITKGKNTKNSLKLAAHHLKQPPQQETLANLGRARKIELVAQSWSKDKVVHVWRDREQLTVNASQPVVHSNILKKQNKTLYSPIRFDTNGDVFEYLWWWGFQDSTPYCCLRGSAALRDLWVEFKHNPHGWFASIYKVWHVCDVFFNVLTDWGSEKIKKSETSFKSCSVTDLPLDVTVTAWARDNNKLKILTENDLKHSFLTLHSPPPSQSWSVHECW